MKMNKYKCKSYEEEFLCGGQNDETLNDDFFPRQICCFYVAPRCQRWNGRWLSSTGDKQTKTQTKKNITHRVTNKQTTKKKKHNTQGNKQTNKQTDANGDMPEVE